MIKTVIKRCVSADQIVGRLNPIIRGWCQYYQTVVSKAIFAKISKYTFDSLFRWAQFKHPTKSKHWIYKTYWKKAPKSRVEFGSTNKEGKHVGLIHHDSIRIIRHVKVRGESSVYDGDNVYWALRLAQAPGTPLGVSKLLKMQKGLCAWCEMAFKAGDVMEVDHIIPRRQRKLDRYSNLQLLHGHCHDVKSRGDSRGAV